MMMIYLMEIIKEIMVIKRQRYSKYQIVIHKMLTKINNL